MEIKKVEFRAGESATMDDLDCLIQRLPTSSRQTGKEVWENESYFINDCEVIIKIKGKEKIDKEDIITINKQNG